MDDVTTLVSGIDFKVRKLIAQLKKLREENETLIIELNNQKQSTEEQKQVIKGLEEKIRILYLPSGRLTATEIIASARF